MAHRTKRLLFWAPRILCILFAVFLSLFALDVFSEGQGFWSTVLALVMHLIPTFVVLAVLALSWRWEWIGAALFSLLGVLYIVIAWGKFPLSAFLAISGPLFVMGALFLLNWLHHAELRANR